jgi:hypothetical protein
MLCKQLKVVHLRLKHFCMQQRSNAATAGDGG